MKLSTDEERAERIKKYRFERGFNDALTDEPPTEASPEYQDGYREGIVSDWRGYRSKWRNCR